jgi:hypothetical protein
VFFFKKKKKKKKKTNAQVFRRLERSYSAGFPSKILAQFWMENQPNGPFQIGEELMQLKLKKKKKIEVLSLLGRLTHVQFI